VECASPKCRSTNVEPLSHYWASLSPDAPLSAKYRQPAAPETRARLLLIAVAAVGLVMTVTGQVGMGLLLLAAGMVGAAVAHRRIADVEADRAAWERRQICRTCTHLWVP
jgi:hypothetical protein